jgi:hypothetical protein
MRTARPDEIQKTNQLIPDICSRAKPKVIPTEEAAKTLSLALGLYHYARSGSLGLSFRSL